MVYQVDVSTFEVKSDNGNFRIVVFALLTCTCQQFQEYQFPCVYSCAAILKTHQQLSQFVHFTYHTTTLKNVYKESVYPVDAEMCLLDNETLLPTAIKQAGCPRKIRLHS
ncbi:3783_t:CDS:1, partial [Ambispora leptoticha]